MTFDTFDLFVLRRNQRPVAIGCGLSLCDFLVHGFKLFGVLSEKLFLLLLLKLAELGGFNQVEFSLNLFPRPNVVSGDHPHRCAEKGDTRHGENHMQSGCLTVRFFCGGHGRNESSSVGLKMCETANRSSTLE